MEFESFKTVYFEQVDKVLSVFNDKLQNLLANHCYGWSTDNFNFRNYLEASVIRYYNCYRLLIDKEDINIADMKILDIGGFLCAFPLTLVKLGYNISITEKLQYYRNGLESIIDLANSSGVTVIDNDMVSEEEIIGNFTHICCLALLEHLPSSPKLLMENIYNNLDKRGRIYIEVPNIAYWRKRWDLLTGKSPLSPIEIIYKSNTPFIGHHHEYTIGELRWLVTNSGFTISKELFFNYSIPEKFDLRNSLCKENIPAYLFDTCKEVMAIIALKDLRK